MTEPLTIVSLQAENYKRLRAVHITADGTALVPITGKNGEGKSSVLDAITAALGGKSYMPSRPVRAGEDEGAIVLELSDGLKVRRTFDTDGGGTIVVESKDGARFPSPQAVLDKLYSSVAFDPLKFTLLDPKAQLEQLRGLVKLEIDVDALTKANADDYTARRDKNRELESEKAKLEKTPVFTVTDVVPDIAAIEATIATAAETNSAIEDRKRGRANAAERIDWLGSEISRLESLIADALTELNGLEDKLTTAAPLPEPIDVSAAQQTLREAYETKRQQESERVRKAQIGLVATLESESKALTEAMDKRKKQITDAIAAAKMPVPGLSFGDGEVLFDDLPLDQASTAQKLRISTAIGMAMAPKLRIMLVRDASLLDEDGYAELAKLGAEGGFQLWVESVTHGDAVGIVMEDGAVKGAPEPAPIDKGKRRPRKAADAAAQEAHAEATIVASIDPLPVEPAKDTDQIPETHEGVTIHDANTGEVIEEIPPTEQPAPKQPSLDYD